jgi:hypothetical protein
VDPKKDRRTNKRTLYETPVSQENLDSGVFTYCKMYNYSKDGLYFESNTKLNPGEEIFIGIENSPYCPSADVYECYHAVIRWREDKKDSNFKFGYGVKFYNPAAQTNSKTYVEAGPLFNPVINSQSAKNFRWCFHLSRRKMESWSREKLSGQINKDLV